jgi:phage gp36-like protein
MAAYLTKAEYLERFDETETINLTDPAGVEIDDDKLEAALEAGSAFVDTHAAKRYDLPFDPAPAVVKDAVADLARERLHTLHPTDEVTARADRVRTWLRDLAKGVVELVDADGALVEDSAADEAAVYAPDPVFTDTLLNSYRGRML